VAVKMNRIIKTLLCVLSLVPQILASHLRNDVYSGDSSLKRDIDRPGTYHDLTSYDGKMITLHVKQGPLTSLWMALVCASGRLQDVNQTAIAALACSAMSTTTGLNA